MQKLQSVSNMHRKRQGWGRVVHITIPDTTLLNKKGRPDGVPTGCGVLAAHRRRARVRTEPGIDRPMRRSADAPMTDAPMTDRTERPRHAPRSVSPVSFAPTLRLRATIPAPDPQWAPSPMTCSDVPRAPSCYLRPSACRDLHRIEGVATGLANATRFDRTASPVRLCTDRGGHDVDRPGAMAGTR